MKHLGNIKKATGATHSKKRVGRGAGSGHGKTSTRGHNGQKSRAGSRVRAGFEGGQMPMNRRLPKFGFTNRFRVDYQELNVGKLQEMIENNKLDSSLLIDASMLYELGLLRKQNVPFKVLGNGEIKIPLNISADSFSKTAKEKIEAAGGTIKLNG
jgi:large subunit ribosomal protein L15